MYKLIAIDMDGTLLNEDKKISEATKVAIKEAREKGVKVVLASGRPLGGLNRYLEELEMFTDDDFVICYNGCQVQKTKSKEIISNITLKGRDLKDIYVLSKNLGVNIHAFSKDGCISPLISKYTELEGELNNISITECDFNSISDDEDIIKAMIVDEPEKLDAAITKIPKELTDKYTVAKSAPFFYEFLNLDANKGVAVEKLCKYLSIKQEEVITIGDADNDLHMIEFAGLGVAMENAFDTVKKVANYITKSNEQDGVAHVINKFVLNK